MGILRALFALAVVLMHCNPASLSIGGRNAVQLFYMISGFLISFVLVERRSYPRLGTFYLNRYLRLYPVYFVVALLSLVAIVASGRPPGFHEVYREAPAGALAFLAVSNTVLFGQDWLMFLDVRGGHLVFSRFIDESSWLWHGLLVPQAWTLGVELTFYVVAPFILPRLRWMCGLLLASLALRLALIAAGLGLHDPWTYRFFPTELALFLTGALSHQVLLPLWRRLQARTLRRAATAATAYLVVFTLAWPWLPVEADLLTAVLFASFAVLLPLTFVFQNHHRFDSWIGNLSYPIYIGHILMLWLVTALFGRLHLKDQVALFTVACVASAVLFAVLLEYTVAQPFDRYRKTLRNKALAQAPLAAGAGSATA